MMLAVSIAAALTMLGSLLLCRSAEGFTIDGPSVSSKPITTLSIHRRHFPPLRNQSERIHRRQNPTASNTRCSPSSPSSSTSLGAAPEGMQWFVKTEQFCKPYPEVKPHLEAHREWIRSIRRNHRAARNDDDDDAAHDAGTAHVNVGQPTVVSGYRVDSENKPGGGGLMIFSAENYRAAEEFVRQDPLIANGCVDWELARWIPETGDIALE